MKPVSLFQQGNYSLDWVKDFYTQAGLWWGPGVQDEENPNLTQLIPDGSLSPS